MLRDNLIAPDNSHFSFSPLNHELSQGHVAQSDFITIPDAHLLFTADFKRSGDDLKLVGDDDNTFVVHNYFNGDHRATLMSPQGAVLSAEIIEALAGPANPGKYAQATAPQSDNQPIGRVATVTGNATAVRNGVAIALNAGDAVLKGDVLQTGSDSALGVIFADSTTFNLTANARMVLNEFEFDPNSKANSALLSLVEGSITFIAGYVAKTGDMKVATPAATMGIRGTQINVEISSSSGDVKFSLLDNGAFVLLNPTTNAVMGNVTVTEAHWVVTPLGQAAAGAPPQFNAQPVQIAAADQAQYVALAQQLLNTQNIGNIVLQNAPVLNPQQLQTLQQLQQQQQQNDPNKTAPDDHTNAQPQSTQQANGTQFIPSDTSHLNDQNNSNNSTTLTIVIPPNNSSNNSNSGGNTNTDTGTGTTNSTPQTPINHAPVARDDNYTGPSAVNEDGKLIVVGSGVLANDTDADGNALTAKLDQGPQHGTLVLKADGSFTYTPDKDYNGTDSFTYKANDGSLDSDPATATITINAVNDAPTAIALAANSVEENAAGATSGNIAVTDVDSTAFTFAVSDNRFEVVGTPGAYQLKLVDGVSLDHETEQSVSLTVTATASGNLSKSQDFTVDVTDVNEAPTAIVLNNPVTSTPENGAAIKVADIAVTDDALGTNVLSLSGADAAAFHITGNQLFFNGGANYEAKSSYAVTVNVDDTTVGSTPDASTNFTLAITDVNEAPTAIALNNPVTSTPENGAAIKVADIAVTDDALGTNVLSLSGMDAAAFHITGNQLFFNGGANFEAKNAYDVTVNVDDSSVGVTPDASQSFHLAITDVVENVAPVLSLNHDENVQDQFNSQAYNLNTGSVNWATNWTETGDGTTSPTSGDIRIVSGSLRFTGDNDSIQRTANLIGASSAILSFDYLRSGLDSQDIIQIQVASDGAHFTTIGQIQGPANDSAYHSDNFDITSYISANTTVRFVETSLGGVETINIDNVNIAYTVDTYVENGAGVPIAGIGSLITDPDDTNMESAKITLTNAKAGDSLAAGTLPGGINSSIDTSVAGQITVTLTGSASKAAYEAALHAVTFSNSTDTPDTTDRSIDIVVNDGTANSNTATTTIHVTAVDDAPVITTDDSQTILENTRFVTALTATDPDGPNPVTFSVSGGDDRDFFKIVNDSLVFKTAPNYEDPKDHHQDNAYVVQVSAFDGNATTVETITVDVTDLQNEQIGDSHDNTLAGANGKTNYLSGLGGNDTLSGANRNDVIVGGNGNDTMTGNANSDIFVFAANFGKDKITDFTPGQDVIEIDHAVFANVTALLNAATNVGHDVVITADLNDIITLNNVSVSQLQQHQNDFHFV